MTTNYKSLDIQHIKDFIEAKNNGAEVSVEDIMQHSGAERLRVYPVLFELEQSGWLEVTRREPLGAPLAVRRSSRP